MIDKIKKLRKPSPMAAYALYLGVLCLEICLAMVIYGIVMLLGLTTAYPDVVVAIAGSFIFAGFFGGLGMFMWIEEN